MVVKKRSKNNVKRTKRIRSQRVKRTSKRSSKRTRRSFLKRNKRTQINRRKKKTKKKTKKKMIGGSWITDGNLVDKKVEGAPGWVEKKKWVRKIDGVHPRTGATLNRGDISVSGPHDIEQYEVKSFYKYVPPRGSSQPAVEWTPLYESGNIYDRKPETGELYHKTDLTEADILMAQGEDTEYATRNPGRLQQVQAPPGGFRAAAAAWLGGLGGGNRQ